MAKFIKSVLVLLFFCSKTMLIADDFKDKAKRVAVLICEKFSRVTTHVDNRELIPAFKNKNLDYEEIVWDDPSVNFNLYDVILIRATWDYIDKRDLFLELMKQINDIKIPLFNNYCIIKWNSNKNYLFDLEKNGVKIIPSRFVSYQETPQLADILAGMPSCEYVIKPAVSGGAHRTFRTTAAEIQKLYEEEYQHHEFVLVQPFINEVVEEGEWSLIFFNGLFSHAVLSKPAPGDFRVQRMHGGKVSSVKPDEAMIREAKHVLSAIPHTMPLYARVDFVRQGTDYLLMELEAIEPALFLQFDQNAAARFAEALELRIFANFEDP